MALEPTSVLIYMAGLISMFFPNPPETSEMHIDDSHNVVWHLSSPEGMRATVGEVHTNLNLEKGSFLMNADIAPTKEGELAGMNSQIYSAYGKDSLEVFGDLTLDLNVLDEENKIALKNLDLSLVSKSTETNSVTKGTLDTKIGYITEFPDINFASKGNMTAKKLTGGFTLDFGLSEREAATAPFKKVSINLAEKEKLMTLTADVTVPADSPFAEQLANLEEMKPMIKQQIQMVGIAVKKLEVTPGEQNDESVSTKLELEVENVKGTLKMFATMGLAGAGLPEGTDPAPLMSAIESLLKVNLTKFAIDAEVAGEKVIAKVDMEADELSNLWDAYISYMDFSTSIMKANIDETIYNLTYEEPTEDSPLYLLVTFQEINNEKTQAIITALQKSDITVNWDSSLNIATTPNSHTLKGALSMKSDNLKGYIKALEAAGIPSGIGSVFALNAKSGEDRKVTADLYTDLTGDMFGYFKALAIETLERHGGYDDVKKSLEDLTINEGAMLATLTPEGVQAKAKLMTSPLKDMTNLMLQKTDPSFEGEFLGLHYDMITKPENEGQRDLKLYFANFMPEASAEDINMKLPFPAEITEGAESIQIASMDAPSINLPESLANLRNVEMPADGEEKGTNPIIFVIVGIAVIAIILFATRGGSKPAAS